jgi:dihydropteroate synthase
MHEEIGFSDVVAEVTEELRDRIRRAVQAGIGVDRIWTDPGIGFGKTADQSLALLRAVGRIREDLGYPIVVGPSRKSFIGAVTGEPAQDRLFGTCAAVSAVVVAGADAVRVHDVGQLFPAIRVADAIRGRSATWRAGGRVDQAG